MQKAFNIIGGLSTIAGLFGYTVRDLNRDMSRWMWALLLFVIFVVLTANFYLYEKNKQQKKK